MLCWKRFGVTAAWDPDRLREAENHLGLHLKAQLNKYVLGMHPFADQDGVTDAQLYWEAKLLEASELSIVALWLHGITVSEASVERSFSYQKLLESPLRCNLALEVEQAQMFVRFNYMAFGDPRFKPSKALPQIFLVWTELCCHPPPSRM